MFGLNRTHFLLVFLLMLFFEKAYSLNLTYEAGVQVESSSNIALATDLLAQEEKIQTSYLNVGALEETGSVLINVVSNFSYIHYENDVYQDESLNDLTAEVTWRITPNKYSWYLLDRYSQVEVDALDAVSVANRQNVNEFISGPDFRWRFGRADAVVVNARAHSFDFDEDVNDNERLSSGVSWLKYFSQNFIMNLTYDVLSTQYQDDVQNTDFDRSNLYVGLDYTRGVNHLLANIGSTILNEDSSSESIKSQLINLTYSRQISNISSFSVGYVENIRDRSEALQDGLTVLDGNFKEKNSSLNYSRNAPSLRWGVEYNLTNRQGLLLGATEKEQRFVAYVDRTVSARTSVNLRLEGVTSDFDNQGTVFLSDETQTIGLELRVQLSRRLSFSISGEERERVSDDINRSFSDNRLRLGLAYTSL